MRAFKLGALIIIGTGVFFSGCSHQKDEEYGKEFFPEVKKFDQLFEQTTHKIGYHNGIGASLLWGSKGLIYGRYLIYMKFSVATDAVNVPKRTSEVSCGIFQYDYSFESGEKRRARCSLGSLTQAQWDRIESLDDLFHVLGHIPCTNGQIYGIEEDLKW